MKEFLTSLLVGIKEKEISNEDKEILRNLLNLSAVSSHKDKFYLNNGYVCGKLDISQNATGFIMPFDKRFKQDIIVENKNLNNEVVNFLKFDEYLDITLKTSNLVYGFLMLLVLYSLAKTARKNSIIPS